MILKVWRCTDARGARGAYSENHGWPKCMGLDLCLRDLGGECEQCEVSRGWIEGATGAGSICIRNREDQDPFLASCYFEFPDPSFLDVSFESRNCFKSHQPIEVAKMTFNIS